MLRLRLVGVLLVSLVCAGAASTQEHPKAISIDTGNDVLEGLRQFHNPNSDVRETAVGWFTIGYIHGILDMMIDEGTIQLPMGVTDGQIYDVVEKYLKDNPATRNLSSSVLVSLAFVQVWRAKPH